MAVRGTDVMENTMPGDRVKTGTLTYDRLAPDTIQWATSIALLARRISIAIDSTGVKEECGDFKVTEEMVKHLKHAYLEAAAGSPTATDATVRAELYNVTDGAVITYVEYAGAGGLKESGDIADAIKSAVGKRLCARINVTTASATAGATQVFRSIRLRLVYGVS